MAARYRTITTAIWEDEWFGNLDSDGKALWFYLLTNHRASLAGIYTIQLKFIAFETGLSIDTVSILLRQFESDGKILYASNVLWVRKMRDYQRGAGGKKIEALVQNDFNATPAGSVKQAYAIHYGYSIDSVSIQPVSDSLPDSDSCTESEADTASTDASSPASHPIQKHPVGIVYRNLYRNGGIITPIGKCRKAWVLITELQKHPAYERVYGDVKEVERGFEWVRTNRGNGDLPDICYCLATFKGLLDDWDEKQEADL